MKIASASLLLANNVSEWWVIVQVALRGHPPSATVVPAVLPEKLADRWLHWVQSGAARTAQGFWGVSDECSLDHWLSCRLSQRARCLAGGGCRGRQEEKKKERITTTTSSEDLFTLHTASRPFSCFEHRLCEALAKPVRLPLFRKTGQTIVEIELELGELAMWIIDPAW